MNADATSQDHSNFSFGMLCALPDNSILSKTKCIYFIAMVEQKRPRTYQPSHSLTYLHENNSLIQTKNREQKAAEELFSGVCFNSKHHKGLMTTGDSKNKLIFLYIKIYYIPYSY